MSDSSGRHGKLPPAPTRRKLRVDMLLVLLVGLLAGILLLRYAALHPETATIHAKIAQEPSNNEPIRHQADSRRAAPFRFLMFNVQNYFVDTEEARSAYQQTPKSEQGREAVAEVIASAQPQVVGVIEIGGPKALMDLQQRLEKRGLRYPYSKVVMRQGEARALAVLSQYSIVCDASVADFSLHGGRTMMRGMLDVTIQTEDARQFRLLGVHLKSRFDDNAESADELRRSEAYAVATRVRDILKQQPDMSLLVFGDWNDSPADASVQVMVKGISNDSSLKRLRPKDSRGENWTLHYQSGHEYCLYDHMFVNKRLAERMNKAHACGIVDILPSAKASDHRALWCELR